MYLLYSLSILSILLTIIFYENKYLVTAGILTFLSTFIYTIHIRNQKKKETKEAIRQIFVK